MIWTIRRVRFWSRSTPPTLAEPLANLGGAGTHPLAVEPRGRRPRSNATSPSMTTTLDRAAGVHQEVLRRAAARRRGPPRAGRRAAPERGRPPASPSRSPAPRRSVMSRSSASSSSACTSAWAPAAGPRLGAQVVVAPARRAVGAEAHGHARRPQRLQGRPAAAQVGVGARAVGHAHARAGQPAGVAGSQPHAVRGHETRAQHAGQRRRAPPAPPGPGRPTARARGRRPRRGRPGGRRRTRSRAPRRPTRPGGSPTAARRRRPARAAPRQKSGPTVYGRVRRDADPAPRPDPRVQAGRAREQRVRAPRRPRRRSRARRPPGGPARAAPTRRAPARRRRWARSRPPWWCRPPGRAARRSAPPSGGRPALSSGRRGSSRPSHCANSAGGSRPSSRLHSRWQWASTSPGARMPEPQVVAPPPPGRPRSPRRPGRPPRSRRHGPAPPPSRMGGAVTGRTHAARHRRAARRTQTLGRRPWRAGDRRRRRRPCPR